MEDREPPATSALHRHQLVHLTDAGWTGVLARPWDAVARACLAHWAAQDAPLVVTQQRGELARGELALGLPAPLRWERRRIALQVPSVSVHSVAAFPALQAVVGLLPPTRRVAWLALAGALAGPAGPGTAPRVHGSFGWQHLTGLDYLHADSDLDLGVCVGDAAAADAAAALLSHAEPGGPRLDGELVFPDGSAVAWREWCRWRARQADRVLVKRLQGVTMELDDAWLPERLRC